MSSGDGWLLTSYTVTQSISLDQGLYLFLAPRDSDEVEKIIGQKYYRDDEIPSGASGVIQASTTRRSGTLTRK